MSHDGKILRKESPTDCTCHCWHENLSKKWKFILLSYAFCLSPIFCLSLSFLACWLVGWLVGWLGFSEPKSTIDKRGKSQVRAAYKSFIANIITQITEGQHESASSPLQRSPS